MLGLPRWRIEATDGWYSIPLAIDKPMTDYIAAGKLKEGTKIITYGAELLDCERGFFPLDVSIIMHTRTTIYFRLLIFIYFFLFLNNA